MATLITDNKDCEVLIKFRGEDILKYIDLNTDVELTDSEYSGIDTLHILGWEKAKHEALADYLLQDQDTFESWSKDDLLWMLRDILVHIPESPDVFKSLGEAMRK